jgi:pimeloyl-ACP methyl ester carboxylesterase
MASLAAAAGLWWSLLWSTGHPAWAWGGAILVGLGHCLILAVEFTLLAVLHGADPTPRAGLRTLVRAWWQECWVALIVFGWRQPFRSNAVPDSMGRWGARGIVFVHGYVCNRGLWLPWLERCHAEGRPCVAVNLEPVFSPLDAYAPQLERAVAKMEEQTGRRPVLVCHSMGGLVARAWMAATPDADSRIARVITIGTPHSGTWLARFSRTANSLHMRQACEWLSGLAEREPPSRARRFTCFYGHADNIVFPPGAAVLPGSTSRHLPGTAHVAMAFHPDVYREVFHWTDAAEDDGHEPAPHPVRRDAIAP